MHTEIGMMAYLQGAFERLQPMVPIICPTGESHVHRPRQDL